MKIVFFGTPHFAAQILEFLLKNNIDVAAVVTKPDRPKGRSLALQPTPVKLAAQSCYPPLPVFQPEIVSVPEFAPVLESFKADLFIVVAYGEILKQHLLDMPRLGCINVHASLLPKYRGAAPIQRCIMEGQKESGVSIMYMVKKMDAGDVIKTAAVPIGPDMTYGELEQELCRTGSQTLLEVLREFENNIFHRTPQDPSLVTFAPKIELEDCEIHWDRPAAEIHNLVRGVNPHPGAWCKVRVRDKMLRLKVNKTQYVSMDHPNPGQIVAYGPEGLIINCSEGALRLLDLQLEGKKAMTAEELMRGIPRSEFIIL